MSLHMSKRLKQGAASIMLAGLAGLSSTSLYAADSILSNMTVEQRLERVERLVGPDVLQKQAQQMDELHQEVSQLRGEVDQLNYDLDMIKQRQRSLYLDMDRRLSALEAGRAVVFTHQALRHRWWVRVLLQAQSPQRQVSNQYDLSCTCWQRCRWSGCLCKCV